MNRNLPTISQTWVFRLSKKATSSSPHLGNHILGFHPKLLKLGVDLVLAEVHALHHFHHLGRHHVLQPHNQADKPTTLMQDCFI